ncbi:phosphatase PAP2 family protein [Paenibacillus glycinis]|uniref:Inositol phosphorylceramide synthase n=1 Tax=Paenibacillus glycinis TaxID=2697035 RepID=A0ABW9XXH5_9BACL|nr:phosphatase PAP2 family protein [Paenibacillus glycinis]NBD26969.1 hypothetical protein [Paenibacillus glycinis]
MKPIALPSGAAPKRKLKGWLPVLWMLLIPFLNLFYVLLNRPSAQVHHLATAFDKALPVIPAFVLPYVLWYPFIGATLIGMLGKNARQYYRTLGALCLGLVACYLVYYGFQTTVERPAVNGTGLFPSLMRWVYANDEPFNCFPSIHVLTSYLMFRGAVAFRAPLRIGIRAMAVLIMMSTLFMKQHVVADVGAGILTAELMYRLVGRIQLRIAANRGDSAPSAVSSSSSVRGKRKRQAG